MSILALFKPDTQFIIQWPTPSEWSIRLVWVTAVALQKLLNGKYKLESL